MSALAAHADAKPVRPRPDVMLVVTPALDGALAANRLAQRHDVPLVLVVQDLMGNAATQSGIRGADGSPGWRPDSRAARCDRPKAIAGGTDAFRPALERYGVESTRRLHAPELGARRSSPPGSISERKRLDWAEDTNLALHTRNLGLKQGLETVVEAARLTQECAGLRWVLMGDGSQREALRERPSVAETSLRSKLTRYFMSGRAVAVAVARRRHRARARPRRPSRTGPPGWRARVGRPGPRARPGCGPAGSDTPELPAVRRREPDLRRNNASALDQILAGACR